MKKFIAGLLVVTLFITVYSRGLLDGVPIPKTVTNFMNRNDVMISNEMVESEKVSLYNKENIGVRLLSSSDIEITGISNRQSKSFLMFQFIHDDDSLSEKTLSITPNKEFSTTIPLPYCESDIMQLVIYSNDTRYGTYKSWVLNSIYFERVDNVWQLKKSPIFDSNKKAYESEKSITRAIKATKSVESESETIKNIALRITANCQTDYEKAAALHDYLCTNFYYDTKALETNDIDSYTALESLRSNVVVCSGFSNAYAGLCRSIDIPCAVVTGYALAGNYSEDTEWNSANINTIAANHAWNEVYVDGRWVIVDTTWDCGNKLINGEKVSDTDLNYVYFDANLEFFSQTHKILKYRDI